MIVGLFNREKAISLVVWYYSQFLDIFEVYVRLELEEGMEIIPSNVVFPILNHTSLLDPIITPIVGERPYRGILNWEFCAIPIIGWLSAFCSFVIVRQLPKLARRKIDKTAVEFLRNGGSVCSTIEGKRSEDGSLSKYKKGPVVMAIKAQVSICPMVIFGSRAVMPHGSAVIKKGNILVKMLKPIPTIGFSYEDRNMIVDRLETIAEMELGLIPKVPLAPLKPLERAMSETTIPDQSIAASDGAEN